MSYLNFQVVATALGVVIVSQFISNNPVNGQFKATLDIIGNVHHKPESFGGAPGADATVNTDFGGKDNCPSPSLSCLRTTLSSSSGNRDYGPSTTYSVYTEDDPCTWRTENIPSSLGVNVVSLDPFIVTTKTTFAAVRSSETSRSIVTSTGVVNFGESLVGILRGFNTTHLVKVLGSELIDELVQVRMREEELL